ncbi:MAG TPA: amino acid permease [Panacibacter sp.]|nr:amino acid permease [Panacibacter sp.]
MFKEETEQEEKRIDLTDKTKIPLRRVLGLSTGILLVAGIMIGSGVFKKIAPMSATLMSEPYILSAWIIAGIFTMFGAFILAALATTTTESGGVYEYLRLSTGNFFSFLYGWTVFTILGSGSIAALAFVFAQSLNTLVHLPDPLHSLQDISIGNFIFPFAGSGVKAVAVIAVCLLTWINYRGTKNGGKLNNIVTAAKIAGILILIVLGLFYSNPAVAEKANASVSVNYSGTALFSALFGAMLSAFWAYDGWSNISFVTGEIKNPKRNVPIAIITGVAIAMVLYVLLNYTFMKVLPLNELAAINENNIAAAVVAGALMGKTGMVVISVLIMVSTFGALNACIIVYPRIYYRMAQENFFFKKVANVHPVFRTPYVSLICSMVWSVLLVLTGTFDLLTNLVIFAGFFFYLLLAWGLIRMKRNGKITIKVIGYPVLPIIVILFCLALLANTVIVQPQQSLTGLVLVLTGVPFYYYFKKKISDSK